MSARSSRSPFDDLDDDDADARSEPEAVSDLSSDQYEDEPQSMTGKGIKRLCSELIELKSASEDDFLQNVYSNYQTFVRAFKDMAVVDSELMNLKQHITTQRRLAQVLENNISLDIESVGSVDSEVEEAEDLDLLSPRAQMNDVLEKLDVLLSERQVDEALLVLKLEGVNLRKMQMEDDHLSPYLTTYASEISDRRARLTEQLILLAGHPRVAPSELQKALSGLCALGEDKRTNFLLLKYYRSRLANHLHELQSSKHSLHGAYMMELAKVVFSVISQAARSFVLLYGEASPYTSDLIQWAREETEALSSNLCKFVKSISEMSGGLPLAVETVKAAISFCSSLNPQRIILQSDLTKLIRPCMEEALQMHVDQLRKVINIFAATDTWVLGKYFISGTSLASSSIGRIDGKMDHCLLSSSGRKFVTLMQAFLDDTSPLVVVQMECSILGGLADLFCGYIRALEKAISERTNGAGNDFPSMGSALELLQQLSILVTSSAVVQLFPSIACGIFNHVRTSNNELLLKHLGPSLEKELDIWMLSIEEASNKLSDCFCQQFVYAAMSDEEYGWRATLETYVDFQHKPHLPPDLIPSFAFQSFFLRMRNLEKLLKPILADDYGILEKLSKELMKAMIIWLSNNLDFWKAAEHGSGQCSCFEQFHLDVDFLVEAARLGGYFSDDLLTAVMNLLAQIEDKFAECESDTKSGAADDASPDDDWSSNAAKLAIEKLLEFEMLKLEGKEKTTVSSGEDLMQNTADVNPSEDNGGSVDGESADSAEEDITRIETTGRDHDGTVKPKEEAEDVEEEDADEILNFSKHEPFGAAESARGMLIDLTERLDQALKFDFLDVSADLETIESHATTENTVLNSTSEYDAKVEQIVKLLLPASEEYEPVWRLDESFSIAVQPEKDVQLVKENSFGVGINLELKSNILEVSDKSDETKEGTGMVEIDEIKYADKATVSGFLIDLEEEFVGNSDVSVDIYAAESAREEPIGAQYLEMMFKLLEVSDNVDADLSHATEEKTGAVETGEIEYSKKTYTRVFPEESFIGELDEFANGTAQSVRATAIALANIENLVSIDKLTKETDPDRYISDLNSSEKNLSVLKEDSSETSSKEVNFTDTLINESANRKALNKVEDIEQEKVLVGNGKEKINDESSEKQDKYDAGNIRAGKAKLNEFSRAKRKRERPRCVINVEHLGKTKRGPATPRPRWA